MNTLALLGGLQIGELILLALLGLLIFGKRLPEVGKNLGKGIVEFKKGLAGVEDEVNKSAGTLPNDSASRQIAPPPPTAKVSTEEDLRAENARLRAQLAEKSPHKD